MERCAVLDTKPGAGDSKVTVTSPGMGVMPELAVEGVFESALGPIS